MNFNDLGISLEKQKNDHHWEIIKQIHRVNMGSASLNDQYQFQVQPNEFTMLKRGGKQNNGIVECFMTATGKKFSNGRNYLKLQFEQPWFGNSNVS